jgi:tRNA modification GTPase
MPLPRSYTGEDVVEIQTAGAAPLLRQVVDALVAAGARPAEPGEFTRRAFRNGRIDLARAESVMALIAAADRAALAGAQAGLAGALSRPCRGAEQALDALAADVEAGLDFPDPDAEATDAAGAAARAERLAADVEALVAGSRAAVPWRPGALVLLYGPRNAGKSSLVNALAGAPRSIVSTEPGTTRDLLEAEMVPAGAALRLVDAPGLPAPGSVPPGGPEAEGVARLRRLAGEADLLAVVLDGSDPAGAAGGEPRLLAGRRGVVVLAKADLGTAVAVAAVAPEGDASRVVRVSARTGEGLDRLRAALDAEARRGAADGAGERLALTARQAAALGRAAAALRRAAGAARDGPGLAFAADDLREARAALGEVTGRGTAEDLLDAVFARFCIGK